LYWVSLVVAERTIWLLLAPPVVTSRLTPAEKVPRPDEPEARLAVNDPVAFKAETTAAAVEFWLMLTVIELVPVS
jgi:hypothetical protein